MLIFVYPAMQSFFFIKKLAFIVLIGQFGWMSIPGKGRNGNGVLWPRRLCNEIADKNEQGKFHFSHMLGCRSNILKKEML